jgi:hypothetical protein
MPVRIILLQSCSQSVTGVCLRAIVNATLMCLSIGMKEKLQSAK